MGPELCRRKFAKPVGGGNSTVHKEVAAGDECAVRSHQESGDGSHLIRCAASSSRRQFYHALMGLELSETAGSVRWMRWSDRKYVIGMVPSLFFF